MIFYVRGVKKIEWNFLTLFFSYIIILHTKIDTIFSEFIQNVEVYYRKQSQIKTELFEAIGHLKKFYPFLSNANPKDGSAKTNFFGLHIF